MNIGMNLLLWTAVPGEEHVPLLEDIKNWGADGVELPMFSLDGSPWPKLAKAMDALDLGRTAVAVLPEGANLIGDAPEERKAAVDFLSGCVEIAASIGADVLCGPYYSPVGRLVGRGPSEDEFKRAVEGFQIVADKAAASGVVLAVEALNRFETYFLNTQAQAAALVDAVGRPAFGQMYDTFHANIEEKHIGGAIATGGSRIRHVHISACDRGTPGDDHIDYAATFAALKAQGYDGWLTIESFGSRLPELAAATCIWREVAPSEEHVVRAGCEKIRSQWGS